MAKVGQAELLKRFKKVDFKTIELQTSLENIKGLFSESSLEPENNKPAQHDPNSIYITVNHEVKKKKSNNVGVKLGKTQHYHSNQHQESHEERQKVYKPGPFALFYELNEGKLDKDEAVWYYKEHKEIVGPVSSYNMDKMVYFKSIQDETKVAFRSVDKFVKFKKVKSIVEGEKEHE